ncbi:hypothetical protein NEOLEDRAFT_1021041, partial [Neolentinus lepideus HHB14362 ss-1]
DLEDEYTGSIEEIQDADQFIRLIHQATLDDCHSGLDDDLQQNICNPPQMPLDIDEPDILFSIKAYISASEASQETYNSFHKAVQECFLGMEMLSYYEVKKLVSELSGVHMIKTDMCINSCMAYAGTFAGLVTCKYCGHACYDPKKSKHGKCVPYQQFSTFPIGPQLQA